MSTQPPPRLPCVEVETGPNPQTAVIWLHGLGADGHDFEPVVPMFNLPDNLPIRFVFPHAPQRPVTINQGMVMPAWYDILEMAIERRIDEKGILESAAMIETLLAHEAERGIPPERTILAGFSQGGAMAGYVGVRHEKPLAGILMLSAYLPFPERLLEEAAIANRATPILICHGDWDPVVPVGLGQATCQVLRERGYGVDWKTYPIQHSVHPDEVELIGNWIVKVVEESSR